MNAQSIYFHLPRWAQEWALCQYARQLDQLYYGESYHRWYERFSAMEAMSGTQAREYQLQVLRALLHTALTHVPWFQELAKREGLRAESITVLEDLRRFPIMEKDPIRRNPAQFINPTYAPKRLWSTYTSGTTGTALKIVMPKETLGWWWALHEVRVRGWAGVSQAMPRAMVGGRPIILGSTDRPPYWRYNARWRQLYMSSYHIAPGTAPAYIDALRQYSSRWITGYGSAIALLGEHLREHPQTLGMTAALTSGDTVSPRQRQAIEQGFGCRMFDYYGSAEACCVISECEHGRQHVQPEAGILEIVDTHGEPCPPGVEGEFLCTGLGNDAMPLIRYRTGDYGSWAEEQHCPCGRQSPLIDHITGRTDDYLVLADGRRIGRLSTAMKKAPSVKQAQLVQDSLEHAWLLVVPDETYRDEDGQRLVEDVLMRIGARIITLEVRVVQEIPPTPVGKHVLVRRIIGDAQARAEYEALIAGETRFTVTNADVPIGQ
jgi:phenylacetate-CoA ligase